MGGIGTLGSFGGGSVPIVRRLLVRVWLSGSFEACIFGRISPLYRVLFPVRFWVSFTSIFYVRGIFFHLPGGFAV